MEQPTLHADPLPNGTNLGPYTILGRLGAGGMGEVYRAHDPKLKRDVAIKVLPLAFVDDPERLARFQREARVLASLNHPAIASIYGFEDSGHTHALVMELVEGPTLAERIRSAPIPVEEALAIAKQIAEGLEYAHERGIIHRDLKPANVKTTAGDSAKILDFGLAKAAEADRTPAELSNTSTLSQAATRAGTVLGTAAYMAPEQAMGKPADRRADIWAFGCLLYEMLTARMAFRGETTGETLAAVLRAEPDWSQLPAGTPSRLRLLLQRCLEKDPKQRLQAIGEARIAIQQILSGTADSEPARAPGLLPRWRQALPWLIACVAVLAAAGLAFFHPLQKPTVTDLVRFEIPVPEKATIAPGDGLALAPDGRKLAFKATGPDGVPRLWVRSLDSLDVRPLPGSEPAQTSVFFWSPDSQFLAFDAGGKLKKINLFSGSTEIVCNLTDAMLGGSWNSDGVIIFSEPPAGLMRVSANGGPASPLTFLDPSRNEVAHNFPSFLPDGRHFIYLRFTSRRGTSGIFVRSLDAKPGDPDVRELVATDMAGSFVPSEGAGRGYLLFIRDGELMAQTLDTRRLELTGEATVLTPRVGNFIDQGLFSASSNGVLAYRTSGEGGASRPTWFDRHGSLLGAIGKPANYLNVSLSPDGASAIVARVDSQNPAPDLWRLDFARGTSTRLTFGTHATLNAVWSPDGNRIVFPSSAQGPYDIHQRLASGAGSEETLLKSAKDKVPTSWSQDGRFVLYTETDPQTHDDLWVLPLKGDKQPFPFLRTEFNENSGRFSPDGHWIAYVSDESGRNEVYVRPFSPDSGGATPGPGGKWLISTGGGVDLRWGGDGKQLYYIAPDGKLMVVAILTRPTFAAGAPEVLFQIPSQASAFLNHIQWDVTRDGKRFLFLIPAPETVPVPFTVVLNWQAALLP